MKSYRNDNINSTSRSLDIIDLSKVDVRETRQERMRYERGSRDDILKLLEKCCSDKSSKFVGIVRINIASPSKASFKLYVLNNSTIGIESSEEIFVYKGADTLKRLIDLLTIPSTEAPLNSFANASRKLSLSLK